MTMALWKFITMKNPYSDSMIAGMICLLSMLKF
jgi:hypothetical protein